MKLSRRVPSQVKTVHFIWYRRDFMEMSDRYREIRSKASRKLDSCHWCKHKFKNGEMMALAQIEESEANKVFCHSCVDEAAGGESDETAEPQHDTSYTGQIAALKVENERLTAQNFDLVIERDSYKDDNETADCSWGDARNTQLQKATDAMRDFLSTLEKDEWARWVEFSQAARYKETTDE